MSSWRRNCQDANLPILANASNQEIQYYKGNFGEIDFKDQIYKRGLYRRADGNDEMGESYDLIAGIEDNVQDVLELFANILKDKSQDIREQEFQRLIKVGQHLAQFRFAHPVPVLVDPDDPSQVSFLVAAGDYVVRWNGAVLALAEARKPNQNKYPSVSGDVAKQDWNQLIAWFLRMREISLANPPGTGFDGVDRGNLGERSYTGGR